MLAVGPQEGRRGAGTLGCACCKPLNDDDDDEAEDDDHEDSRQHKASFDHDITRASQRIQWKLMIIIVCVMFPRRRRGGQSTTTTTTTKADKSPTAGDINVEKPANQSQIVAAIVVVVVVSSPERSPARAKEDEPVANCS